MKTKPSLRDDQSGERSLARLRKAYAENRLTLYLGAGVSVGNGLPNWHELVLAMYFSAIAEEARGIRRPFPNYLYAIAEWHLQRVQEPLDITARRLRMYYQDKNPNPFVDDLRETLYAGFALSEDAGFEYLCPEDLRNASPTLDAVASLCEGGVVGRRGVRSVVTQNYDSLLEIALGEHRCEAIWKADQELDPSKLPIYHVHGYVPIEGEGSTEQEIVFTEEQYHLAARDAYSWPNLAQIQCMSSSVGLMVGLSLSDRPIRRLLDAVMTTPVGTENYALLRKPSWEQPTPEELNAIDKKALEYYERFERSGVKKSSGPGFERPGPGVKGDSWDEQIRAVLGRVESMDVKQQEFVLKELGVQPIWYKHHTDIPAIIEDIMTGR